MPTEKPSNSVNSLAPHPLNITKKQGFKIINVWGFNATGFPLRKNQSLQHNCFVPMSLIALQAQTRRFACVRIGKDSLYFPLID